MINISPQDFIIALQMLGKGLPFSDTDSAPAQLHFAKRFDDNFSIQRLSKAAIRFRHALS